jgi:hypothetical protein
MNTWRYLFQGKEVTSASLAKAKALLNGVSGESPLHIRLAKELAEIQTLRQKSSALERSSKARSTRANRSPRRASAT